MKRTFFLLWMCLTVICAHATEPSKRWGQLQVNGAQLCDKKGKPVVLRGVSMGWHNFWPRFYNEKAVKWLKEDWKATVIRAAMGTIMNNNYIENKEFALQCIEPVIKAAIKNNIYVIVDWHSHEIQTKEAVEFFAYIAEKYGKYPNVIYEIFNEPVNDSWERLKVYAETVIEEIRKYDKDNIILVGNPHWDQDIDLVAQSPLTGFKNIMYTVHFYAATHKAYLRDKMVAAVRQGIPVFVSECAGMEASGDGTLDYEEWQKWNDTMEAYGISWVNWSVSDKNETCSMLLPEAKSEGEWTDNVIKEYGHKVRENLRKYNNTNKKSKKS